jgi:hypothetical protein
MRVSVNGAGVRELHESCLSSVLLRISVHAAAVQLSHQRNVFHNILYGQWRLICTCALFRKQFSMWQDMHKMLAKHLLQRRERVIAIKIWRGFVL